VQLNLISNETYNELHSCRDFQTVKSFCNQWMLCSAFSRLLNVHTNLPVLIGSLWYGPFVMLGFWLGVGYSDCIFCEVLVAFSVVASYNYCFSFYSEISKKWYNLLLTVHWLSVRCMSTHWLWEQLYLTVYLFAPVCLEAVLSMHRGKLPKCYWLNTHHNLYSNIRIKVQHHISMFALAKLKIRLSRYNFMKLQQLWTHTY
jgi:hypothetical protein